MNTIKTIGCLAIGLALLLPPAVFAQDGAKRLGFSKIELKSDHSMVVRLPHKVKRVSVGQPEVLDVLVINPRQIYLNAKKAGTTNVSLWKDDEKILGVFEVRVIRDLTRLKQHLHEILPAEQIEVREMEGAVLLSGRVSSDEAKKQAEAVAKAFAPKRTTSVLQVGGTRQVLLKVRFAEVSRKALKRLNFNLGFFNNAGAFAFTFLNGLVKATETTIGLDTFSTKLDFGGNMNGIGGFNVGGARVVGFLDALKQNGLARILAEPNLVATSGAKAEFLAGGEYPIPVPQRDNITIEFKKFGVQIVFQPIITADNRIRLTVEPEVSELDQSNAVVIENFRVPGLITRRAKTHLELEDGQAFAIAGLFREDMNQTVDKFPFLGDIPVLGALFRSNQFQTAKTELVIVVTPELVKPGITQAKLRIPGEKMVVPSDMEMWLLGDMVDEAKEKGEKGGVPLSMRELEGDFGHAVIY